MTTQSLSSRFMFCGQENCPLQYRNFGRVLACRAAGNRAAITAPAKTGCLDLPWAGMMAWVAGGHHD